MQTKRDKPHWPVRKDQSVQGTRLILMILQLIFNPATFIALVVSWYLVRFHIQLGKTTQFNLLWWIVFNIILIHLLFLAQLLHYLNIDFPLFEEIFSINPFLDNFVHYMEENEVFLVSLPLSSFVLLSLLLSTSHSNLTGQFQKRKLCKMEMRTTRIIGTDTL